MIDIKNLLQFSTPEIKKYIQSFLPNYYDSKNIKIAENYMYAAGNLPVCLVAHVDTAFSIPPEKIYYDSKEKVFFGDCSLGADDRAGVYAILYLIEKGYTPSIIFCDCEETGGLGAWELTWDEPLCPFAAKYFIEIDRRGFNEFVTYGCDNTEFDKYISSFGLQKKEGTFSDIDIICPAWKIAGCNVSAGYVNEHSLGERLHLAALFHAIFTVEKMLQDSKNCRSFKYILHKKENEKCLTFSSQNHMKTFQN